MQYVDFFFKLFLYTFSIFAGLLLAFRLIWPKIESTALKFIEFTHRRTLSKEQQQLKFAAYERLLLFVHRIEPKEIMWRHREHRANLPVFRRLLLEDVENEFQHNFTQQLYVSDRSWAAVRDLKEDTLSLLRNVYEGLPAEATFEQYFTAVSTHVDGVVQHPYRAAQQVLKSELSAH